MDQTVVDVTQIEADCGPLKQGEEVVLIGRQGEAHLSAEKVSARVRTNNYDIVSRILARVPRVYV
jgi:alanine racemase